MVSLRWRKKTVCAEAEPKEREEPPSSFSRLWARFRIKTGGPLKICLVCGTRNPVQVLFCRECGSRYAICKDPVPGDLDDDRMSVADPREIEAQQKKSWLEKGNAFYKSGQYQKALEMYDQALRIDPQYVKAWNNRSLVLGKLGREREASDSRERFQALQKSETR
jgi:tetratricopeptide (TPR) repeat protein